MLPTSLGSCSVFSYPFDAATGLKINLGRSKLVLVGQILHVDGLADTLGCKVSHLQLKYLALPLGGLALVGHKLFGMAFCNGKKSGGLEKSLTYPREGSSP